MKLIVGLGNPEKKYNGTRHNVGFSVLDQYAKINNVTFQVKDKFKSKIAELNFNGKKVLLAKPLTYYNLVGEAIRSIVDFYKISPEDTLVVHDDLTLPLGIVRTREGGSDGGNNGIKSINQYIGPNTCRLRVGTHDEIRENMSDTNFVLGKLTPDDQKTFNEMLPRIHKLIDEFIVENFVPGTHREIKN